MLAVSPPSPTTVYWMPTACYRCRNWLLAHNGYITLLTRNWADNWNDSANKIEKYNKIGTYGVSPKKKELKMHH